MPGIGPVMTKTCEIKTFVRTHFTIISFKEKEKDFLSLEKTSLENFNETVNGFSQNPRIS